jgi:DNA-binding HxlR family transcriptional regulator
MALLDLLGRRWQLRILWELREGPLGFRALQQRCDGMSPSVLSERLAELVSAGIAGQRSQGTYELTPAGSDLLAAIEPLNAWAARWALATAPPAREQDYPSNCA